MACWSLLSAVQEDGVVEATVDDAVVEWPDCDAPVEPDPPDPEDPDDPEDSVDPDGPEPVDPVDRDDPDPDDPDDPDGPDPAEPEPEVGATVVEVVGRKAAVRTSPDPVVPDRLAAVVLADLVAAAQLAWSVASCCWAVVSAAWVVVMASWSWVRVALSWAI
jgi:hypothetical protein